MKGFATSPNPFFAGLKPRVFLAERVAMLKREKLFKAVSHDGRIEAIKRYKNREAA